MRCCKNPMFRYAKSVLEKHNVRATTVKRFRKASLQSISARTTSSATPFSNTVSREDLVNEAAYLTKALYRNCIRSVRLIRWGNSFDDKEFQRREEEFQNPTVGGVISMAPPPNKEDELRSRAEYYHSYTREYFTQESDCLENDPLLERDIRRYLYYLRKGEKDRKWLLGDMLFPDPYKNSFDHDRVKRFEAMSRVYFGEAIAISSDSNKQIDANSTPGDNQTNDGFIEDDDPDWFQKVSDSEVSLIANR